MSYTRNLLTHIDVKKNTLEYLHHIIDGVHYIPRM